jgi:hypothetical protein
MEANQTSCYSDVMERQEKVQVALARLQSLKSEVSELRAQCEALRMLRSEKQTKELVCNKCGKPIAVGDEITVKDTFGPEKSHYHGDCLKRILSS